MTAPRQGDSPATEHPSTPSRWPGWPGWPWLCAAASGLLLILCFPPFDQGWLIWLALTPLITATWWPRGERTAPSPSRWRRFFQGRHPFALGLLAGTIFFAGVFHWLAALGVLFRSPGLYALPLLLGLYLALYPGFWAWFLHLIVRPGPAAFSSSIRNLGIGAAAACAWVGLEWWRSWFLSGFNWNMLAVAMRRDLAMIQIADLTGAWGLSWLIVFTNVMAVVIVRRILSDLGPNFLKRVRWEFSATMALIAAVFAYGARTLLAPPMPTTPLRVAALQPNIPQAVKFGGPEEEDEIFAALSRHHLLAASMEPAPQLIVWPESATPRGIFADELNSSFVREQAQRGDFSLLLGSLEYDLDPNDPQSALVYNSAVLLTDRGAKHQSFRKTHLVIFGEYLPLRWLMPQAIIDLVPGDLSAGTELTVLTMPSPHTRLGALVCFEDTDPHIAAGLAKHGAQLLVNITNDGWFLHTIAAEQHLANAVLRTVESRRPLLRSTNTGVTCLVDSYGRVDRWLEPFQEGVGVGTVAVPTAPALTFYARHGDWFAYLTAAISAAVLGATLRWRRREIRSTAD
jgi:apolipoprotein N-acyltransferase